MIELGIPVYKARKTLPDALDSLVAQTYKKFFVCLSIDCDGEDYKDIISTYRARGLKIRVVNGKTNGGPGVARQRILDTTQCDYIMFLDSDDMLTPRAVEVLYTKCRLGRFDIINGAFIREMPNSEDLLMAYDDNTVTWMHSKVYRVGYLKEKNIRFLPDLRTDEDSYFNAVAWNSTQNKAKIDEVLYIWRNNSSSITRQDSNKNYFCKSYMNYIRAQVEAFKYLHIINRTVNPTLITSTLINIYYYYMRARFYKLDEKVMDKCISSLKKEKWMQNWLNSGENWLNLVANLKQGQVYDGEYVIFYEETFNRWADRLLKEEK